MERLLLLFLFITYFSQSQNIRLYETDVSNYPYVKSKVVLFNNFGEQVLNVNKDNLTILENNVEAEVLSLTCSEPADPVPLSGILAIDISASMEGEALELAKFGARAWINLSRIESENAIIGFSDQPYLFSDFTDNKTELNELIDDMELIGGTNIDRAFREEKIGALDVAKNAQFRPIIILLTDGITEINTEEIIQRANELDARIFSIILYKEASSKLRDISSQTGGFVFDSVRSANQIANVYRTIFQTSESLTSCEVEWLSPICDNVRRMNLNYGDSLEGRAEYRVDPANLPQLSYPLGKFIVFNDINPGEQATKSILVKADFFDIEITEIKSDNPFFTVEYPDESDLPLKIEKDDSDNIRIRFNYDSNDFETAKIEIISTACLEEIFFASGGKPSSNPGNNSIKVEFPNGGETFASISSNTVSWSGTLPESNVRVELSTDNGKNWTEQASQATGFSYDIDYPDIESDSCLIRLTQYNEEFGEMYLEKNTEDKNVNSVAWSPNGSFLLTGNVDGKIRVLNPLTGNITNELIAHTDEVKDIAWSPDAIRFASVSLDSTLRIHNSLNFSTDEIFSAHNDAINCLDWSSDGNYIATGGDDKEINIWETANYTIIQNLTEHNQEINDVKFSPDNSLLASCANDSLIKIFNTEDWSEVASWKAEISDISRVEWVSNSEIISVSLREDENSVKHWDINGNLIKELEINGKLFSLAVNREDGLVAFGGETGQSHLYNIDDFSENINYGLTNIWSVRDIEWSPDGSRFVSGIHGMLSDVTLQFFSIDRFPSAQDQSDSVFSLQTPDITYKSVDMGTHPLNKVKEEIFLDIFANNNSLDISLDSIDVSDKDIFDVDYDIIDGEFISAKFYFKPTENIIYNSDIIYYTNIGELTANIRGEGILPDLSNAEIDFGKVVVGESVSSTISLTNNSLTDLDISNISFIGPNSQEFDFIQTSPTNIIAPNDDLILEINYQPDDVELNNRLIKIDHNGANSPSTLNLLGEGILPEVSFNLPDTLYYSCYNSNTFQLEITNTGIGDLLINKNEIIIGQNEYSFEESIIKEDSVQTVFINYNNWNKISELIINLETNVGNIERTIPIRELITSFEFENNSQINFFQTIQNNRETKSISVVNTGETDLELSQSFPIQIQGGLFEIDYSGPIIIPPSGIEQLQVTFEGGNFGDFGNVLFDLLDICENKTELTINWNIQSDSDPLSFNRLFEFDELVCNNIDTLIIPISNISEDNITINNLNLVNLPSNFNLLNSPDEILSGDTYNLEVEFSSNIDGNYSNEINIEYLDIKKSIELNAVKKSLIAEINENEVEINLDANTFGEFTINNNGSEDIILPIGQRFGSFVLLSSTANPLPTGETATIIVSYEGTDEISSQNIYIDSPCGILDSINVIARGSTQYILDFTLPTISSNIGDIIDIPVQIETDLIYESISLQLKYNKHILEYLGNNQTEIDEDFEIVNFDGINNDNNILSEFRVLWGNDSVTSIEISSINVINPQGDYLPESNSGLVRVLDLCYEGGTRLYFAPEFIIDVGPNPTNNYLNINYSSEESRELYYSIKNMITGELIKNGNLTIENEGSFIIDISRELNGIYLLEINSQQNSKTIKIIKSN